MEMGFTGIEIYKLFTKLLFMRKYYNDYKKINFSCIMKKKLLEIIYFFLRIIIILI